MVPASYVASAFPSTTLGANPSSTLGAGSETMPAQAPDGAVVYHDYCAKCHDEPTGRTPSRDALKARTPDTILASMNTGSMSMQALALGAGEKRAVAEFLAGKPIGAANIDPAGGLCAMRPSALPNPASMPRWSGWGNDSTNT